MTEDSNFIDYRLGNKTVILQKDLELQEKMQNEMLKSYIKFVSDKKHEEDKYLAEVKRLREAGEDTSEALAQYRKFAAERKRGEQELADAKKAIQFDLDNKVRIASENAYKNMSARERREYSKNVAENLRINIEAFNATEARHNAYIKKRRKEAENASEEERAEIEAEIEARNSAFEKEKQNVEKLKIQRIQAEEMSKGFMQGAASKGVNLLNKATKGKVNLNLQDSYNASKEANEKAEPALKYYKERAALQKEILTAQLKGDKTRVTELKNQAAEQKRNFEESGEQEKAKAAIGKAALEGLRATGAAVIDGIGRGADNLISDFKASMQDVKNIDKYLDDIFGDQAKYLAKLEGSNEKWRKSVDNVSDAIGFSGFVKKTSVIGKMKELVDSGIAYNIELRAFLAETSANIASTFEATNGTLLRMIRIQQQDSTAARLGMEATLTKLFNKFFEDTTYLKDVADNISSSILDASATLGRDMSLEFEYSVQKWLGSLYSIGMSGEGVQKIAQGINYLGTGDVNALNSNAQLQTLLVMGANKAGGKSYTDILTGGLTANDTNNLLRGIIEYLKEISSSQTNMVTKSAYANLFGMSVTDLSTFANIKTSEIESLYKESITYDAAIDETEKRLSKISKNMNISEIVQNAIDNATAGVATTIGGSAFTYGTWKALGLLKQYVGEVKVPGIIGFGTGISSGLDLLNLAQTFMVGMGTTGSLLGALGSMLKGGPDNLKAWKFEESTERGKGLTVLKNGVLSDTSYSAVLGVGSASGSDMEAVSMESGTEKGLDAAGVTSEELSEGKETPQKIYDAINGDDTPNILSVLQEINDRLAPDRVFYTAISGVTSGATVSSIDSISSSLTVMKSTANSTVSNDNNYSSNSTSTSSNGTTKQNMQGQGSSDSEQVTSDLSDVISTAVAEAIRTAISSYGFSGVPVNVTNGGY